MVAQIAALFITLLAARLTVNAAVTDQNTIDYIGQKLDIKYDVITNLEDEAKTYKIRLTLSNTGSLPIETGPWEMYFCHIRKIAHLVDENGTELGSSGLKAYHVNGCQFKISPMTTFKPISPGENLEIIFLGELWSVAKTDIMPNWYVAGEGFTARTILSTAGESLAFAGEFDTREKWKRYWYGGLKDNYDPYTPDQRYDKIDIKETQQSMTGIIPTPREYSSANWRRLFLGTGDWVIVSDAKFQNEAKFLSEKLKMGIVAVSPQTRYIKITSADVIIGDEISSSHEAYAIKSNSIKQSVQISGKGNEGVFCAIQTLLGLLGDTKEMAEVTVTDSPRFNHRGMHVDVGRNFHTKESILKLLDVMSMYKLNRFHFHLSDDEGWRLEIPGLEHLTTLGSKRCHDLNEKECLISQLGSGPAEHTSGSGYYTVQDYQEILRFAARRHIEVIPEFDMPGHAHAAIKAMEAKNDSRYTLSDPLDTSTYLSVQFFTDNALNPCLESSYNFVDHVVKEVQKMHSNINELKTFHFGGDEVAKTAWIGSPACVAKHPLNSSDHWMEERKKEFVFRVANITAKYGVNLGGWEDGLIDGKTAPYEREKMANKYVMAHAWQNVWEWGVSNRAYKLANAGYQVVMSQATHLYFDHPYEPDPEERGYYWAPRFIDTRKTFGFMPDTLYRNADFRRNGQPITEEQLCSDGQCVPLTKTENIIGIQGQLWSETVRTGKQLDNMIFPRLLALAERAWHRAAWENEKDQDKRAIQMKADWETFANLLGHQELARLDKLNVMYHIPPPGVRITNSVMEVKSVFPGLPIEFRRQGSDVWSGVKSRVSAIGSHEFRVKSADSRRTSRIVRVDVSPPTVPVSATSRQIVSLTVLSLCLFLNSLLSFSYEHQC